jgi:hypothetical protein
VPADRAFHLSITRAFLTQLTEALDALEPAPLTPERVAELRRERGVYQLFERGVRVYVGKADELIPTRLTKHWHKIRGRQNTDLAGMTFGCLYIEEDAEVVTPEQVLINHYRNRAECAWNVGGFGSNDPGQQRDTQVPGQWDLAHPIRLDILCESVVGAATVGTLLNRLKSELPYVFRFARLKGDPGGHPDYSRQLQPAPTAPFTAADAFELLSRDLPGWQITALPGVRDHVPPLPDRLSVRIANLARA